MRPPAATLVQSTGSLIGNGESVKMGVDKDNIEHLLMLLTDLYSDQVLAILREYSTNAWDSHVSVGQTRPIEVTLPSQFNPTLVIRDFGSGLSRDDMVNVYSQYGSSTKRETNDANGMFGIGCKSALTYSQQFTVVSVKDGMRLTALVSRAGTAATMDIIDTRPTNEANGVEISVPVKTVDTNDFRTKAEFLYSFWKQGTVLVNGAEPTPRTLDMVTDTIGTVGYGLDSDIIVMGNVPYPVGKRLYDGFRSYGSQFYIVAHVNIGDVSIPPSREAVMYTATTEATIEKIKGEFAAKIKQTIIDDIDSAPDHVQAYKRKVKWQEKYSPLMPNKVMYQGIEIPDHLQFDHARYNSQAYSRPYTARRTDVAIENLIDGVMITDWPGLASLSKSHKEKIKTWKQSNGITANIHIMVDKVEGKPWVDDARIVSWNVIKKIVLPSTSPGFRKAPSIDVYDPTTGRIGSVADLDKTKTPVYISPTARLGRSNAQSLCAVMPDIQIVSLGENRWDKFKRENPTAVPLLDYIRTELSAARDMLTADDLKWISLNSSELSTLKGLDENLLDDPDLAALVRLAKAGYTSPTLTKYTSLKNTAYSNGLPVGRDATKNYLDGYPLLDGYYRGTLATKHIHLYLNAVYADSILNP